MMLAHTLLNILATFSTFLPVNNVCTHTKHLFSLTSLYSTISLLITYPIITTMQAPCLLDVRFKADDSDSDHHGLRTHTSVYFLLGLLTNLLTSTTASRCKHAARISKTELR